MISVVLLTSILSTFPENSDADHSIESKLTIGGYIKADFRNVSGELAYRDFWIANNVYEENTNETRFNTRESRINFKFEDSGLVGFLETDFYANKQPTGSQETISGGHLPRLRHAYVKYKNWTVGQTWSTFMPIASIPESLDFGGPHVAQVCIRQTQIRFTYSNFEFALENPSVQSGQAQTIPDAVIKYNLVRNWGQVSVGNLVRTIANSEDLDSPEGTQLAHNIHGLIYLSNGDLRFSFNTGGSGRYVGPGANTNDFSTNRKINTTNAYTLGYRRHWNNDWRTNIYYGSIKISNTNIKRQHKAINLIAGDTKGLNVGIEVGNYHTESGNSDYIQFSAKYNFKHHITN